MTDGGSTLIDNLNLLAIGASAGGVEAISRLLAALPADFPLPVAVVLHLPPHHVSLLPQLLAQKCALRVKEVEDKEPLRPGVVYIAAPDYHMLIESNRTFALSCDDPVNFSRPSIDVLFESAAIVYGNQMLAIVLTGASADGAEGLKAVCEHGGQAWVQNPVEAAASYMPQAAIARSGTNCILSLEEMTKRLSGRGDLSNLA